MPSPCSYRIGILADDLTSAADGAGPFVDRGLSAVVGRGQLPDAPAAITAVDSQSRSAGVRMFEVPRELEPGFLLGRATRSNDVDLLIAMKAGGFGDDDTLRRAVGQLRQIAPATEQLLS